jgi:hypothetical protein
MEVLQKAYLQVTLACCDLFVAMQKCSMHLINVVGGLATLAMAANMVICTLVDTSG